MISKEEERQARCLPMFTQNPVTTKTPELYPENLQTLSDLLDKLGDLSQINGVFEIELRVRVDDVDTWAVIGYGESGDPCVLRFESDPKPPVSITRALPNPFTINNKLAEGNNTNSVRCRCGDWTHGDLDTCGPNGCYNVPA